MNCNDNYGTYDRFIAYRAAIMQAIAKAWRDDQYREQLIANPKKALKEGIGYDFPFNMDLAVDPDNAVWEPDTLVDWHVKTQNRIILVLPPAPAVEEQVEALAEYNANHLTFLTSSKN